MEADLSRVLGSLSLEGEELGEVIVPDVTFDLVGEKFQYSLVGRVQIWNLPLGFVNKEMGLSIGAHIGTVLEVDTRGLEQERGCYVRVKVALDISKPLKRGGFVPMRNGRAQVVYCYEKICDVSLYYGMLGHEYFNCEDKYNDEARKTLRVNKYDPWILVHGERRLNVKHREGRRDSAGYKEDTIWGVRAHGWRGGMARPSVVDESGSRVGEEE
ncbi:hypothetical protein LIER_23356 [Lithospermum erythrorhizon]|uniref:Zinc knuckle CX2CX4HX4C domain-containing protein n=1 Tax=Lithospermum erythrorhizon TaxID=34254 RepID=A0AAV3QX38_LITER